MSNELRELDIPLSKINNLLKEPINCYASNGEIITISPVPPEEWNINDELYYIVDYIPDWYDLNFILIQPPTTGRNNTIITGLEYRGKRVYPILKEG